MSSIFFTSGTGGEPKPIIYSKEDIKNMRLAMSHFYDLCPLEGGVILNVIPPYPNLGFHFAKMYEEFADAPMLHAGVFPINKILTMVESTKPIAIIGLHSDVSSIIRMSIPEALQNLHTVVIANGCLPEHRKFYEEKGINLFMTYGFTEAKMAWITDKNREGYFVFKDSGRIFKEEGGQLILYSPDYLNCYETGDFGKIIKDTDTYQVIGLDITRGDGRIKANAGCIVG